LQDNEVDQKVIIGQGAKVKKGVGIFRRSQGGAKEVVVESVESAWITLPYLSLGSIRGGIGFGRSM
jgi:hypothetical protein